MAESTEMRSLYQDFFGLLSTPRFQLGLMSQAGIGFNEYLPPSDEAEYTRQRLPSRFTLRELMMSTSSYMSLMLASSGTPAQEQVVNTVTSTRTQYVYDTLLLDSLLNLNNDPEKTP